MAIWSDNLPHPRGVNIIYQEGWNFRPSDQFCAELLQRWRVGWVRLTANLIGGGSGFSRYDVNQRHIYSVQRHPSETNTILLRLDRAPGYIPSEGSPFWLTAPLSYSDATIPTFFYSGTNYVFADRLVIRYVSPTPVMDVGEQVLTSYPFILHGSFWSDFENSTGPKGMWRDTLERAKEYIAQGLSVMFAPQHGLADFHPGTGQFLGTGLKDLSTRWGYQALRPILSEMLDYVAAQGSALPPQKFCLMLENEPTFDSWTSYRAAFLPDYLAMARAKLPLHTINVAGPEWNNGAKVLTEPPPEVLADPNTEVAWHQHFTLGTWWWLSSYNDWRQKLEELRQWERRWGRRCIISEWNYVLGDASILANKQAYMRNAARAMEEAGVISATWGLQNGGIDTLWSVSFTTDNRLQGTPLPAFIGHLNPPGLFSSRRKQRRPSHV